MTPFDSDEAAFYAELGRRIKAARKRRRMTQGELAVALGLSRPTVANIETGRQRVYAHLIYALAAALAAAPREIMPPIKQRDWLRLVAPEAPAA